MDKKEKAIKTKESKTQVEVPAEYDEDDVNLTYASGKERVKGGILGFFIGLAVIVPGVSGSAVAIIFKMYQNLLFAIGNIFKQFKRCFLYLLPILIGAVVGFCGGFFGVRALLNIIPFIIIAFFAGLMLGAYPAVTDEIKGTRATAGNVALFVLGLIVPIAISVFSIFGNVGNQSLLNLKFYHYLLFLVLGFLVAITQLVPGLSATALLMAVGYFTSLMNAVSLTFLKSNPSVLLVYLCLIVGFLIGMVVVSKCLSFFIKKNKEKTFWTISGLSLGSMLTMFFNPEVMDVYKGWANNSNFVWEIVVGVIVFAVGLFISYWFVNFERNKNLKTKGDKNGK